MRKSNRFQSSLSRFSIGVPVKDKPLPARKALDGLGRERCGVFDVLGFVEHAAVKLQLRICFNVLPDKLIGRDPHVAFCARSTKAFTLCSVSQNQLIAQLRENFCSSSPQL